MAKNKSALSGIVYSTDPGFKSEIEEKQSIITLDPSHQKLIIKLETKQRAGKAVTVIEGFSGDESDRENLGKKLKAFCGTGGSVKEGVIMVQGDNREKILQWLLKNGFKNAQKR